MLYSSVNNETHLSHWFHDDIKKLDTLQVLNCILHKTYYQSRMSIKLYPLALKLFSFHKLLVLSNKIKGVRTEREQGIMARSPNRLNIFVSGLL